MSLLPRQSSEPPSETPLNVLSFGAGAIGTYIGGSLALRAHRVVFVERPEVAEGLRQTGLHLKLADGEHHLADVQVVGSLSEALERGAYDLMLLALKSFDTEAALDALRPFERWIPPVVCLQNGVDNEPRLAELLGDSRVLAATVTSAIARRGAGNIALERLRGVGLVNGHALSRRLAAAFSDAGLRPQLFARANDMKWSKLLTNLLANAQSALLDLTPAQIFADPKLFQVEMAQLGEALAVMQALGARVVNLPGTPVRLLALGAQLPAAIARPLMRRAVGAGRGGKMPSFHIDLHSGRGQTEVVYLNGAVWRYGERLGIATPVNRRLTEELERLSHQT